MTIVYAGLTVGAVYAIVALGFNMILASSGIFNFAAPQFILVGAMIAYQGLAVSAWSIGVIVVAGALIGGVLGALEERLAIRPLKNVGGHGPLVTTIGASIVIQGAVLLIWNSNTKIVPFPGGPTAYTILGGRIALLDLLLIVWATTLGILLHLASKHTRLGLAGRASTSDLELAMLRGVDVRRVRTGAFVLSGSVLTASGALVGMKMGASVSLGHDLVIIGFVALALGGFGSYVGALVGGLLVGVIELRIAFWLGEDFRLIFLYLLLLAVLLTRPTGLFGEKRLRSV